LSVIYNMNTINYNKNPATILDFSLRTVSKILRRANKSCDICNWNEASCDIHHIKEKKDGGSDNMENLTCVCPNCHRKLHQFGDKFKTEKELRLISLDKTFPEWLNFYNPVSSYHYQKFRNKNSCPKNNCLKCNRDIPIDNIYCSLECAGKNRIKFDFNEEDVKKWASENLSMVKIGKIFNVTDNSIRKRMKKKNLYELFISLKISKKIIRKPINYVSQLEALKIKKLIDEGKFSLRKIGKLFRRNHSIISDIKYGLHPALVEVKDTSLTVNQIP
jgi:hypothetical protein